MDHFILVYGFNIHYTFAGTIGFKNRGGKAKIDNKKYKKYFSKKAKMLNKDEALEHTGHAIGGVCPFGLKKPIDVYLDVSLKKHSEVIPAAGDRYSSIRMTVEELEKHSSCKEWVDVCKYD